MLRGSARGGPRELRQAPGSAARQKNDAPDASAFLFPRARFPFIANKKMQTLCGCYTGPYGPSCSAAADSGHLECLKQIRCLGYPWEPSTAALAARGGHLEVLKWLRANGCPWDEETCSCAAGGGQLEVLKWLRANGCPWDEGTPSDACTTGSLDCLRFALENGCPWDRDECVGAAADGGCAKLRVWLERELGELLEQPGSRRDMAEQREARQREAPGSAYGSRTRRRVG